MDGGWNDVCSSDNPRFSAELHHDGFRRRWKMVLYIDYDNNVSCRVMYIEFHPPMDTEEALRKADRKLAELELQRSGEWNGNSGFFYHAPNLDALPLR